MKRCPFCKKEITASAMECPFCKMVLVEKIPTTKTSSNSSYAPPKEKATRQNTYTYTPPKNSYSPKKQFQFPKINGWVISIVGSILLSVILNYHGGTTNPLPEPTADITTSENSNPLPTPTTPIAVADIKPITHAPYNSLPNGTVFFKASMSGSGILKISNGSGSDAVVKLVNDSGKKIYSVYIRTNNSYSIKNINDGTYRVLFAFGSDWDSSQKKFLVDTSAEAFDDNFTFNTYDTNSGDYVDTHYQSYEITLNPVAGGTAITNPIDPSVFDKY